VEHTEPSVTTPKPPGLDPRDPEQPIAQHPIAIQLAVAWTFDNRLAWPTPRRRGIDDVFLPFFEPLGGRRVFPRRRHQLPPPTSRNGPSKLLRRLTPPAHRQLTELHLQPNQQYTRHTALTARLKTSPNATLTNALAGTLRSTRRRRPPKKKKTHLRRGAKTIRTRTRARVRCRLDWITNRARCTNSVAWSFCSKESHRVTVDEC